MENYEKEIINLQNDIKYIKETINKHDAEIKEHGCQISSFNLSQSKLENKIDSLGDLLRQEFKGFDLRYGDRLSEIKETTNDLIKRMNETDAEPKKRLTNLKWTILCSVSGSVILAIVLFLLANAFVK